MDNGMSICPRCGNSFYQSPCPCCGKVFKEIMLGPESLMTPEDIINKVFASLKRKLK
jgi:predicted amidophosphoribosyltransferase